MSDKRILSIDLGSSSIKFAVYEVGATLERLLVDGEIEPLETPKVSLSVRDHRSHANELRKPLRDKQPIAALLATVRDLGVDIDAVGHRLVYGGHEHDRPARVTADLMIKLGELIPFDPLHMAESLAAVREIEVWLPGVPQVVCFDTAFHRRMPLVAQSLPLPPKLCSHGIRRYGFHGLAFESIVSTLGEDAHGKLIVAHLGNGASIAAIQDGNSVDTTMGFTPLGGLVMGTRPGDLDPGVLLYALRELRETPEELAELLTHRSGLLGMSQISSDMRVLLEQRAAEPAAADAIELFVYQARKHLGALVAVLGGLDTLVFTGGIGEHAADIRWEISDGLAHFGIELEATRNAASADVISTDTARVVVRVIAANENLMIARHAFSTLFASIQ